MSRSEDSELPTWSWEKHDAIRRLMSTKSWRRGKLDDVCHTEGVPTGRGGGHSPPRGPPGLVQTPV